MKRLRERINFKNISKVLGIVIGVAAIYFSLKNIRGNEIAKSLESMKASWIIPIVLLNFAVIGCKALRWQFMITPVKRIHFLTMFRVLIIGFMANNILPARLGEAVRVHMLGRDTDVSKVRAAASLIADRVIETVSFLMFAALLMIISDVPKWMHLGLSITLGITITLYLLAFIYSKKEVTNPFLKKIQDGVQALLHLKLTLLGTATSLVSWLLQGVMLYMTQVAFGIELPIWGIILVLLAINLAVAVPSTPGHVGTFEFASILAYTYLGLDKSMGLLVGATFHILQIIPVTLVGGVLMLTSHVNLRKIPISLDPKVSQESSRGQ
jgi:hypothetical protein